MQGQSLNFSAHLRYVDDRGLAEDPPGLIALALTDSAHAKLPQGQIETGNDHNISGKLHWDSKSVDIKNVAPCFLSHLVRSLDEPKIKIEHF